jgi:hypothetical protein
MTQIGGPDVDGCVTQLLDVLGPHADRDWSGRAGPLDWSCRQTVAHIAHDLLAYAAQLTSRAPDAYLPLDLTVREGASTRDVLRIAATAGGLLGQALRAAAPGARAWHWGPADPSGFAALGMTEILVHTWDVCQGLGVPWQPTAPDAGRILRRLVPDAPDGDPADVLLWATGRADLPGRPRPSHWVMRAAVRQPDSG